MYDEYKYPGKCPDIKSAVPVEVQRIFDSCSERDCISALMVTLDEGFVLSEKTTVVKTRCAEVSNVCVTIDSIPFKNGYYAVDITYTFRLTMDAYEYSCTDESVPLCGTAVWNKRVILYGSKANIKTFSSTEESIGETDSCCRTINLPKVTVSVVEPIALETKIDCINTGNCGDIAVIRGITVTLGLFSVIRLTRPVCLLVPTYDYCIPDKECASPAESPCEVFGRLDFPTEEFFPSSCPMPAADNPPVGQYDADADYPPDSNNMDI